MGFIGVQTRGRQGRLPKVFCCSIDNEIQALILGKQRLRRKSVGSLSGCLICIACWLARIACQSLDFKRIHLLKKRFKEKISSIHRGLEQGDREYCHGCCVAEPRMSQGTGSGERERKEKVCRFSGGHDLWVSLSKAAVVRDYFLGLLVCCVPREILLLEAGIIQ